MIKLNAKVKNIQPHRFSKAYAKYGTPAKIGETGTVVELHDLRDATIVVFETSVGRRYAYEINVAVL